MVYCFVPFYYLNIKGFEVLTINMVYEDYFTTSFRNDTLNSLKSVRMKLLPKDPWIVVQIVYVLLKIFNLHPHFSQISPLQMVKTAAHYFLCFFDFFECFLCCFFLLLELRFFDFFFRRRSPLSDEEELKRSFFFKRLCILKSRNKNTCLSLMMMSCCKLQVLIKVMNSLNIETYSDEEEELSEDEESFEVLLLLLEDLLRDFFLLRFSFCSSRRFALSRSSCSFSCWFNFCKGVMKSSSFSLLEDSSPAIIGFLLGSVTR